MALIYHLHMFDRSQVVFDLEILVTYTASFANRLTSAGERTAGASLRMASELIEGALVRLTAGDPGSDLAEQVEQGPPVLPGEFGVGSDS